MHTQVRTDVKNVLDSAYGAIKNERYSELHGLSDHIIHSISIYQEKEIADCAVAVYALNKIFQKNKYLKHRDLPGFRNRILRDLDSARKGISKNNMRVYTHAIRNMHIQIKTFDKKVGLFEQPLLDYAKVQKASKLVEHGISTSQASEFMKVPEWELNPKVGKTTASELKPATATDNRRRVALVKKLFKV